MYKVGDRCRLSSEALSDNDYHEGWESEDRVLIISSIHFNFPAPRDIMYSFTFEDTGEHFPNSLFSYEMEAV